MDYNKMKMSKRVGCYILLALVVIGLVLFFTVGRSKENYSPRNKETFGTYWADQAYQLDLKKLSSQEAYDKVMKRPERRRKLKYLKLKENSLIFKIKNTRNMLEIKMLKNELKKTKGDIKKEKRRLKVKVKVKGPLKVKGPFMPQIPIIGRPGMPKIPTLNYILSTAKGKPAKEIKKRLKKIGKKYGITIVEAIPQGSPVTRDYRKNRIRIFYNEDGLVTSAVNR